MGQATLAQCVRYAFPTWPGGMGQSGDGSRPRKGTPGRVSAEGAGEWAVPQVSSCSVLERTFKALQSGVSKRLACDLHQQETLFKTSDLGLIPDPGI